MWQCIPKSVTKYHTWYVIGKTNYSILRHLLESWLFYVTFTKICTIYLDICFGSNLSKKITCENCDKIPLLHTHKTYKHRFNFKTIFLTEYITSLFMEFDSKNNI